MLREPDVGTLPTVLGTSGPTPPGDRLAPGDRAGDYVIDHELGRGGMGEVYAGHHPVIGKKVAVKVMRGALATSPEAVARFTREARAVNHVDHPNVVDVFAMGHLADGRLYLVMDLAPGESLRARVGRGRLAPAEALAVLEPVAAALDAAHARGVVHRDLKPDNVMVAGDLARPTIKVLDFGIAKLVSSVAADGGAMGTATLTGQGTWLGTPAYMAPEQWSADGAVPASDRYALAAMAFELLAGRPPFQATSAPALMEQHFRAAVPTLTGAGASLPAAVDTVIARGLAKDPDARYPSAAALVAALRDALGTQIGGPAARAAGATVAGAGPRRSPALPIAAGLAGLAVTGAGVWIVARDRAAPRAGPPAPTAAAAGATAQVLSTPGGADIVVDGTAAGVTPRRIDVPAGHAATIELRKPGYLAQRRTVAAGEVVDVALQPVDGFQGTWAMTTGELRRFVRQGDAVVALRLAAATDRGTYYRRFQFVPSSGAIVSFVAEEEYVDPKAPDEPTCHVPLRAQYDYDLGGDELELKKERVKLDLVDGHCVVVDQGWADPEALTRVDRAADGADWAESRAGGAAVPGNDDAEPIPNNPAFEPKDPRADAQAQQELPRKPVPEKIAPQKTAPQKTVRQKTAPEKKRPPGKVLAPTTSNLGDATSNGAAANEAANTAAPPRGTTNPDLANAQAAPQAQIVPNPEATAGGTDPEGPVQLPARQRK